MVDMIKLEEKKFINPSVIYIKELFLNSCYTGLAFAEAMALSEHDFEWNLDGIVWCKMYRTKSDELCSIPMLPSASTILKKYREEAIQNGRRLTNSKTKNKRQPF